MTKKDPKKVKKLAIIRNSATLSLPSLERSITEFEKSPRFSLLKSFSLSKTIQLQENAKNKDLTFEEFVALGAKAFLTKYKPDKNTLERLLVFLKESAAEKAQSPGTEQASDANQSLSFEDVHKKSVFNMQGLPDVDIINARQVLTSTISKLKSSPQFKTLQDKTLEQFWESSWPRAPFEEALTLKQISELNADAMLKKRSLVPAKIAAISGAIAKALRSKNEVPNSDKVDTGDNFKNTPAENPRSPTAVEWLESDLSGLPSYAKGLISFYESQASLRVASESAVSRLLRELPSYISARDLLTLWFANEHSAALVGEMLHKDKTYVETILPAARQQVKICLEQACPSLIDHWRALLSSPGLPLERLLPVDSGDAYDKEFLNSFCALLLKSSGAQHPALAGVEFTDLWSNSRELPELICNLICNSLPLPNFELKRRFKILLPFFDQIKLITVFANLALLDDKTDVWLKKP